MCTNNTLNNIMCYEQNLKYIILNTQFQKLNNKLQTMLIHIKHVIHNT